MARLAPAQTLGGLSVYNFLRFSPGPQLTALGGVNVSQSGKDPGLCWQNPSLLNGDMPAAVQANFSSLYGGISVYQASVNWRQEKWRTNFSGGLVYFNYGQATETDAAGNILGTFRPRDWALQVSASRQYGERWHFGSSLKFIRSEYGQYRSAGIAADAGVHYRDTSRLFSASLVIKNIGSQLSRYAGSDREDLPFEVQAGVTQRLKGAPLSFSLTGQRLHRFDIRYDDTTFNNANGFPNGKRSGFTPGKVLDHLILSATVYLGEKLELYTGYNFLRRRELNIGSGGNGLNGFSLGAGLLTGKWQLRYGRAWYQAGKALNQLGITLFVRKFFNPSLPKR